MVSTMQCWKRPSEDRLRGRRVARLDAVRRPRRRGAYDARSCGEQLRQVLRVVAFVAVMTSLGACGAIAQQTPGALVLHSVQLHVTEGSVALDLGVDCRLSGPMQDALDHGIPLTLRIDVRAGRWPSTRAVATRHVELRYFPLSRRYQLRETEADDVRSFATPSYLVAALDSLRISLPLAFATLPAATPLHVSVALDPTRLPGALRLPALFEPAWRFAAKGYSWHAS